MLDSTLSRFKYILRIQVNSFHLYTSGVTRASNADQHAYIREWHKSRNQIEIPRAIKSFIFQMIMKKGAHPKMWNCEGRTKIELKQQQQQQQ